MVVHVLFDRGHPWLLNINFIVQVDVIRVKSCVVASLTLRTVRVPINALYLVPK